MLSAIETLYDGQIHRYSYDAAGKIQGTYIILSPKGTLIASRTFTDSTPNGIHQEYYHNGQLKSKRMFAYGQETGSSTYYHPDGTISSTCMIFEGKCIGIRRGFWANGNYTFRETYQHGVLHGPTYQYYESGAVHIYEEYVCGQMTQRFVYNELGEIVEEKRSPPRGRICARCGPRLCDCIVADPVPFATKGKSKGSPGSSAPPSPTNSYFDLI
jgi:antitoxin component YwqK of YwqJK toxin-antitoxin module